MADQIVHAVVGEDRDAVALAHAEMMQRAGEALHRRHRLRIGQRLVAIDPAEGELVGLALGPVIAAAGASACVALLGFAGTAASSHISE